VQPDRGSSKAEAVAAMAGKKKKRSGCKVL
jgi:hypothetical protein